MKRIKKGFTLTELVVVICIIGILLAVLIPLLFGYINKTYVYTDTQVVREMNEALVNDSLEHGKHQNMQEALDVAEKVGYIVENINASKKGNEIFWDQKNDAFCYMDNNQLDYVGRDIKESDKLDPNGDESYYLWRISDTVSLTDKWSVYYTGNLTSITTSKGFDVGSSPVTTVRYINTTGKAQNVTITTNGGTLEINGYVDPADKTVGDVIYHFGKANNIDIIKCAKGSYHENGEVTFLKIQTGRIVIDEDSVIGGIHAVATEEGGEKYYDDIVLAIVGEVEMPIITRDRASIDDIDEESEAGTYTQFVLEVQTISASNASTEKQEFIYASVVVSEEEESKVVETKAVVSSTSASAASQKEVASNQALTIIEQSNQTEAAKAASLSTQESKTETNAETAAAMVVAPAVEVLESWVAMVGSAGFDDLQEAINAANAGDTVKLLKDLELNGFASNVAAIAINKSLVLDGNNHSIVSDAGRTIWITSGNVNVTIKNLTTVNTRTSSSGYPRGIQVNSDLRNVYLNIYNCDVTSMYYALNFCAGTTIDLVVEDSVITGWAALNIWSNGVSVYAKNTKFVGYSIAQNMFAAIVLEGDTTNLTPMHSSNMTVDLYDCEIEVGGAYCQSAIQFNDQALTNVVNLYNCKITHDASIGNVNLESGPAPIYLVSYDKGTNNVLNFDDDSQFNGSNNIGLVSIYSGKGLAAFVIPEE